VCPSMQVFQALVEEKGAAGLYEGIGGRAVQCFVEDFVFFWCVQGLSAFTSPSPTSPTTGHICLSLPQPPSHMSYT